MTTELAPAPTVRDKAQAVLYGGEEYGEGYILPPEAWPDVSHFITEDDAPVDNIFSEKQQHLLTEPLMSSWAGPGAGRSFVAFANVGLFYGLHQPVVVPDVMLSLDVALPDDIWSISHRSYMVWEYGKPPDVVIEIVSNQKGGEDGHKLLDYAKMGVDYYVIFDPMEHLDRGALGAYGIQNGIYVPLERAWFPQIGLGLKLWTGNYERREDTWLRWCDEHGVVITTGKERAEKAEQRAEQERTEKERALLIAEQERTEKERALHEKQELARITACNLLPLLNDEQISSHATGLSLDEVRSLR
jgi:Uma2 family endonuclease